jgi:hypothetical protein
MRLESESEKPIDNPTPEQLEQVLRSLRLPGNSFAILGTTPSVYMQTARNEDGSFHVEYQEGALDKHYRMRSPCPIADVIDVFKRYLVGDKSWRSKYEWQWMDLAR